MTRILGLRPISLSRVWERSQALLSLVALVATAVVLVAGSAPPAEAQADVVFDDMEHGDPGSNGWFSFGSDIGGGGIGPNSADLPPELGGSFSLETGWGSGGNPGFYGGFGRTNPVDVTGTDHFNMWLNPDGGLDFTLEINLQEDTGGDEFQSNCVVSAAGPCAVAGGGWQMVSIPLADFFDDNSFMPGGNGTIDGPLVNVVIAVIGNTGTDAVFRTDYWAFTEGPITFGPPTDADLVTDFSDGVAPGGACPPGELPLGFCTFNGAGSSVLLANPTTPPAPELPGVTTPNLMLEMGVDVTSFAGFIHGFEPQDWSTREGMSFWFHGTGSNTVVFVDVLDNRSPGSTVDDAERYSTSFTDDFVGWQLMEFPFSSFTRKEIGNSAPNDGFGRFEVHGWALGTLDTGGLQTYYVDEVRLYGTVEPPALAVQFANGITLIPEGATGQVAVKLNRPMTGDDPAQVSIGYRTERSNAVPGEEFTPAAGTLTFVNGGPSELSFAVETFDDSVHEGNEQIIVRLVDPVGFERGALFQASVLIEDDDPYDPDLLDDFEHGTYLWDTVGSATIAAERPAEIGLAGRPGAGAYEHVMVAAMPVAVDIEVRGTLCTGRGGGTGNGGDNGNGGGNSNGAVVPVHLLSTEDFDATQVDVSTVRYGEAAEAHGGGSARHVEDVNGDGLADLVLHFRIADIGYECGDEVPFVGATVDGQAITAGGSDAAVERNFALAQDWSSSESLDFWYYGSGNGDPVTVTLKDNRAPDPGPAGWTLSWADEFDGAAGTTPDPANWVHEIGDVTPDGKNGWGNDESQYYTDDSANAATDGSGNLVITLDAADPGRECYYGPCEYESARLLTQDRAEFAYGRIESRLRVPTGGSGLWPAFWSLGTDITRTPWPASGEIDIMEYVSRLPNEIFGTVHGPNYAGGASIGDIYDFGGAVSSEFHTFAVEWQPGLIVWYVDGIEYHRVTPTDLPGPWVFDKPFFLLLNLAVGGNFGGAIDPELALPQHYLIDYVRVYQAPDTAERFEAGFVDDVAGWRQVSVPLSSFERSEIQPAGAPDDGLGLAEVWGYGFAAPAGTGSGNIIVDQVELTEIPPPLELTVTTAADSGTGSLRQALASIADGGTITFATGMDPTVSLTSGQLLIQRSVTIDGSGVPGLAISGGGLSRVFEIAAAATVAMNDLTIRDGAGAPQGGGVLNHGDLTLVGVTVADNTETSPGPANWQFGGGGIYNGADSTLALVDSTVDANTSLNQPGGGIYGFLGSTMTLTGSTVSNNAAAADVAGGIRSLGTTTLTNSTVSGNISTAWHGGGIFHTDGGLTVTHSTVIDNAAPGGTGSGVVVATFEAPASATLANSVIGGRDGALACYVEGGASAMITSTGGNVDTDGSCFLIGPGDQANTNPLLAPLTDNGGPTQTHLPDPSSPAIDAAQSGDCTATDQRGVSRPQGPACDSGSVEAS